MSEAIIIALIGIVPSVLVAIVSIISNNAIVKVKIEELENFLNEKIKSGMFTAIITLPIGMLKRWFSIVPIPDTPPGAILFGAENITIPRENSVAPIAITI